MNSGNDFLRFIRSKTTEKLELCFYYYGILVSKNPWTFIIFSFVLTMICSTGLLNFRQEKNPMKLWIPPNAEFKRDTDWFMSGFGEGYRVQAVMITAPDVLQSSILLQLLDIRSQVITSSLDNVSWQDVCFRVPVVQLNRRRRRRRRDLLEGGEREREGDGLFGNFEPSVHLPTSVFCRIVSSFSTGCYENSILEFWKYDREEIENLTKEDIILALNQTSTSPVLGLSMDYAHLLGGVVRNESGVIVAATSLLSHWMVHVNFSAVDMDLVGNDGGTADWATGPGMIWEQSFLNTMSNISKSAQYSNDTQVFYEASRSFGDISSEAMFQDLFKIGCGVIMTFCFVLLVLSKGTWLEFRILPAAAGMMCILLAFVSACGLCSALGVFYGPVHTSLPFLLMGIGVDDMFVIMACRQQLNHKQKRMSLPVQIGLALRHAGVSITVTSFTDIVASTIGGTTILPALESFCLYAAAGVLFTFIYQATFYVAVLVLDEHRIEKKTNPLVPCLKHQAPTPVSSVNNNTSCTRTLISLLYSKLLLTKPVKVLIVVATCCFTAFCVRGVAQLRQQFDPKWFLPSDSYLVQYLDARDRWYADSGQEALILLGRLNYTAELGNIEHLIQQLNQQSDIVYDVSTWYQGFTHYVNFYFKKNIPDETLSEEDFNFYLGKFLYSPSGGKFQKNFRFERKLECGEPASPVKVSTLNFKFRLFKGPEEAVPAMNRIRDIVRQTNITSGDGFKTVWSKAFATWTTDEVIQHELYRNLLLSVVCVMGTTSVLILNFSTCFWIFVCVVLTLVDILGMMYYWGLTIDIVSCIALVLGVGLCIDYAAHVGQTFLHMQGSCQERALLTVNSIGMAVINGGFSTLLAMSILSLSTAYVFKAFFKIFFLVVTIGLFHGVVLLPVVLSCIGPEAEHSHLDLDLKLETETHQSEEMQSLNSPADKPSVVSNHSS